MSDVSVNVIVERNLQRIDVLANFSSELTIVGKVILNLLTDRELKWSDNFDHGRAGEVHW
jgi:hypothetical protein